LTGIYLRRTVCGMDATTFAALGEPSRLKIVELLRVRPCAVGEIADRLGIRQPQVSKHLRVLSDAGLVDVEPVARQRI
jgi:DNA-binding transcriptional ArsR family regulator